MQKYSFLMSVYKKEKPEYLKQSINSMLNQTAKPNEIIIVKDGPLTKDLDDVINSYKKKNSKLFTIISLEENVGLGLALNEGIKKSRNELIARMDSDDICKPSRCKKQLKVFDDKEIAICGSNIDEFDGAIKNVVGHRVVPEFNEDIYEFSKRRSAFNHPTVMYRKSAVLKFGGYANMRRNQDIDLFGRMIFEGAKAYNIQESLLYFRADDELSKRRKSWKNTKSYIYTIRNFWKMGYSSFFDYMIVLLMQTAIFICPTKIQSVIYKKLLRK